MDVFLRSAALAALVAGAPAGVTEPSAWTAVREGCRLESEKVSLSDGYQTTSARLVVTASEIRVLSESTFDGGGNDLLIQVDKNDPVKADGLAGEKVVSFKSGAPSLVSQFKAGLKARVQLRFWPTWPETGAHSVSVSLIGFTKAWDTLAESCTSTEKRG